MSQNTNRPVKEFRTRRNIRAAVWANPSEKGDHPRFSVTVEKRYRDSEGNWQTSHSYFRDEIPDLRLVLSKAFEHISLQEPKAEGGIVAPVAS